jgi:hypothetical protein
MTEFCSEGSQASPASPSDSVQFYKVPSVAKATKYEIWKISKGGGCMGGMQCNVELGNLLSICSGTKENRGKP